MRESERKAVSESEKTSEKSMDGSVFLALYAVKERKMYSPFTLSLSLSLDLSSSETIVLSHSPALSLSFR